MNIKKKDKQVLDRRIDTLKTIYIFNFVAGCLMAVLALAVASLVLFFPQTDPGEVFVVVIVTAGFVAFSVRSFILARKYKMMHDALCAADPDNTEEKELFCYKYDFLSNSEGVRHNRQKYVYAVCVNTVHGQFYYVLEKEIDRNSISVYCCDLYSGEHKFEVYKGTNIIKSFPELDKRIRSIPQKFLDL